jgi:sulfur relay (sulfurtransferase) DsrC/TusE family protein
MPIEVSGKSIETDEEGYLANRTDWNEDVAKEIARVDYCVLS